MAHADLASPSPAKTIGGAREEICNLNLSDFLPLLAYVEVL